MSLRSTTALFARALPLLVLVTFAADARPRPARASAEPAPEAAGCETTGVTCRDAGAPFEPMSASEVATIMTRALEAVSDDRMTVALVDRAGRVLALARKPGADPANDDLAVGTARTSSFFSHDMAPLSSRTVRFLSGIHFPPGAARAQNGALYGIENTNRGCDLNIEFNEGKCLPPAASVNGLPCNPFDRSGCGTGPVTGKTSPLDLHEEGHPEGVGLRGPTNPDGLPVNSGGIPIFRVGSVRVVGGSLEEGDAQLEVEGPSNLVGGVGVVGVPDDEAEFAAFSAVALSGTSLFPSPRFPLPRPERVFIDGIRLPFVEQASRPEGTTPGSADGVSVVVEPRDGGCVPNRYLAGPVSGSRLSAAEVDSIVRRANDVAWRTRGSIRLPVGSYARMVFAVADLDGTVLGLYRMPDATVFSVDVAVAKARNVVFFSGRSPQASADLEGLPPETSVTNRSIGFGAQPLFPPGIDGTEPGPFFDLFLRDLGNVCSQGSQPVNVNQNGVVFFAGSLPLYREGELVGGLGVSGDGVEQDDYVAFLGAEGFWPDRDVWADQFEIRGVRMPFLKYPRTPLGVTEPVEEPFDEP